MTSPSKIPIWPGAPSFKNIFKFLNVEILDGDPRRAKISARVTDKNFFYTPHYILNSLRGLWNDTISVPRFYDTTIQIIENTTNLPDMIIREHLLKIPTDIDAKIDIDHHNIGWVRAGSINLFYCDKPDAHLRLLATSSFSETEEYKIVGRIPFINSEDSLIIENYHLPVHQVLDRICSDIIIACRHWSVGVLRDNRLHLLHAIMYLLSTTDGAILGIHSKHLFLDKIDLIIGRGNKEDITKQLQYLEFV